MFRHTLIKLCKWKYIGEIAVVISLLGFIIVSQFLKFDSDHRLYRSKPAPPKQFYVSPLNLVKTDPNTAKVQFIQRRKIFIDACNCWKDVTNYTSTPEKVISRCADDTWLYGGGQKVISYSLYRGNRTDWYLDGLHKNWLLMRLHYPGWFMRIYSDIALNNFPQICPLLCTSPEVFWCDVHSIPGVGNVNESFPMTWRFLPVNDPLVDTFLSRDLDSPLSSREKEAVDEWLQSTKAIHIIRDHLWHDYPVLGGLWGARPPLLHTNLTEILQNFFIKEGNRSSKKGQDQDILRRSIYTDKQVDKILAHDSVYCWRYFYSECRPFPKLLIGEGNYVGSVFPPLPTENATPPQRIPLMESKDVKNLKKSDVSDFIYYENYDS